MGLFKKNKKVGLIADIIRCDEPSYLIWKWHPDGTESGEHKREYAIRSGSQLRVKDGEVAVFVYRQKDGKMQDFVVGPFDQKLKTANLPILSAIIDAFHGGDTPFQAEVYFINLSHLIQTKFAVPYFDVCDPRYPDFTVPVAVRGTISFRIADYREFIKLHRLNEFDIENFKLQVQDAVARYVKSEVASAPAVHKIPVIQIETLIAKINDSVEMNLKARLKADFGVEASGVDIGVIEIDKTSDSYQKLMAVSRDMAAEMIFSKTEADLENYTETFRIQREEGKYAAHMQTKSANIAAYQLEKQTEVGVAGAEALGQMGANNAGNVSLGNGMGFNPAAMMASMAVGGAIGKNIASAFDSGVKGAEQTPPEIPKAKYNVAKDGKPTGPFDVSSLSAMVASGALTPDTLVWTQGMDTWVKASTVEVLKALFPPEIPKA